MPEIKEIRLLSNSLERAEQFYTGMLGLKILNKSADSISFSAGSSVLTFIETREQNPVYHFAFNIPCNKLEEAVTWLSSKTKIIETPETGIIADFRAWNAKAFYFFDTNGNILECIARFDLDNKSGLPFTGSSILSVSEIAVAADDVAQAAAQLISALNIPVFSKQPLQQNFGALGDNNGLIILSKTGRNWYPTEMPAEKYFSVIAMSVNGVTKEIVVNGNNT